MNVLELFSGTHSVGKVAELLGWKVVSVDMILPATHHCDIMDFNYKQYDKDYFDIVWASPPCTNYSHLQNSWLGRKRHGVIYTREIMNQEMLEDDKLIVKTLEIINYFNCHYWFIENPASSRMKDRDMMKGINNYVVDYCMYSDWGYRKRTRIWTNKTDFQPRLCDGKGTCGNMIENLHKINLGNDYTWKRAKHLAEAQGGVKDPRINKTTQEERYRIPEDLIISLFLE